MRLAGYRGPLWTLIACALIVASSPITAQPAIGANDASQPARIVESYSLTSALDINGDDPKDWRLLGSNDGGNSWVTLDMETNQVFKYRAQRLTFHVPKPGPYNIYRLQVDSVPLPEFYPGVGVHLAELFFAGPMAGVTDPSDVVQIITSSHPHPIFGPPENAFDGDPASQWVDYGLFKPGGCWLQMRYGLNPETLITNINEAMRLVLHSVVQPYSEETGARVMSNLNAQASISRKLTGYALTSANDAPERDPRQWELLGSDDDGKTWTVVDSRADEVFTERFERRVFNLNQAVSFRLYRLRIGSCYVPGAICQIAEVEPLYADPQDNALYSLVVDSIMDNPPMEATEMAFDGNAQSKWLCFRSISSNQPAWIQWQTMPKDELPVISKRKLRRVVEHKSIPQLVNLTNSVALTVNAYALTSADDWPERDPSGWTLQGSSDGGRTWQTLDERRAETFTTRLQRRIFKLTVPASARLFRLQIHSTASPVANAVQLEGVELLYDRSPDRPALTAVATAQGENSPFETVEKLFNGDMKSKWLDFADSSPSSNHASWVEWYYVNGNGLHPISLERVQFGPNRLPDQFKARFNSTVLAADAHNARVMLADSSGCEQFRLDSWPGSLVAGTSVSIEGDLRVSGGELFLSHVQPVHAQSLPSWQSILENRPMHDPAYCTGSLTGKITAEFSSPGGCGAMLVLPDDEIVKVHSDGSRFQIPPGLDQSVTVNGVVEFLPDEKGTPRPSAIWATNPGAIKLLPPSAQISKLASVTNAPRSLTSIPDVVRFVATNSTEDACVKVRGVITYVELDLYGFYLQNGENGVEVGSQSGAGLGPNESQEGNYVEVQGVVHQGLLRATNFVTVLGRSAMPKPLRPPWDLLMTGQDDGRWVEVEGIITAVERQRVTLSVGDKQLVVWINEAHDHPVALTPGSLAEVRGVCSAVVNNKGQRLGVRLLTPRFDCITLVSLAPEAPFDLPTVPIGSIMQSDGLGLGTTNQWVKTKGVVTCRQGRMLFLQDGNDGIRVSLRESSSLAAGDIVEAAGLPQPDGFSPQLTLAVVRKTGAASLPPARAINLTLTNANDMAQTCDGTRAHITATLVSETVEPLDRILSLSDRQTHQNFCAHLANDGTHFYEPVPPGSVVKLEGVFKAIREKTPDADQTATAFEMYINSANDLVVLERASWWTPRRILEIAGSFSSVLMLALVWIWMLRKQVRQRTQALDLKIQEHERSEAKLTEEVAERKRLQLQADKTHKELIQVARKAGMAEVATEVLHNVGNVLNSVNISALLAIDRLKKLKADSPAKVASLMRQNESELGAFFSANDKGRKLLPYLDDLTTYYSTEKSAAMAELNTLAKNIEHIKNIVAVQQAHAKYSGIVEPLQLSDVLEDALRMDGTSLERHKIEMVRRFDARVPLVNADKHKLIQIFVNLIRNAKQSCLASDNPDKTLTLHIFNGEGRVKVSVMDNGVGIAQENINCIFNQGFTTKKDGHGFGLHNSALAAKEMGGALKVFSSGPGQGATFTLEFPVVSVEAGNDPSLSSN